MNRQPPKPFQNDPSQNRPSRALFALWAMQATEEWHIVHCCEQYGMVRGDKGNYSRCAMT
jgi:hypothetical protein